MTRKRERIQVIRDILKAIQDKNGKIKPTHILYKANLSHEMLQEYLHELISKNFIIENITKEGKRYELTENGFNFLNKYSMISEFVDSFGLNEP